MKRETIPLLVLLALLLAAPVVIGCAGQMDLQPGVEAYVDAGGRRAVAVGVQGPRLQADSDGVVLGTGSPDAVAAGNAIGGALNAVGTVVAWIGGLLVVTLLAVGGVLLFKKKKE